MSKPLTAFQGVNDFFEVYARALEQYDTKQLTYLYTIPCTMMSDDMTTFFTEASKIEGFFNQGAVFYKQFGIVHARPEVWSKRAWTDKIVNARVNWQYFDSNNKPIYNCDYHYILKTDKNSQLKIVLSASVNEKERMEEWQGSNVKM